MLDEDPFRRGAGRRDQGQSLAAHALFQRARGSARGVAPARATTALDRLQTMTRHGQPLTQYQEQVQAEAGEQAA